MNRINRLPPRAQTLLLDSTLTAHEKLCALRRRAGQREVLVLGDSHVLPFLRMPVPVRLDGDFWRVISVEGATVSGLPNPRAKTQAMQRFGDALGDTNAREVVVCLGEVDTGFVIWHRAQAHEESVEAMLAQALSAYRALIEHIAERHRVTLISAPLPTIPDGPAHGEVARQRAGIRASQAERIALTRRFNDAMAQWARENGIHYLHLDAESLGPDGRVRADLLNPDISDHHYDRDAYRRLLLFALARPPAVGN